MGNEDYRTPGQLIEALVDEHGWDQYILGLILGIDKTGVSKLISGKKRIDADLALALADALGVDAERFLALQQSYDLQIARISSRPDAERVTRAVLFGKLPISEMIHRGWLNAENPRDVKAVESELARFFGVESAADVLNVLAEPYAAKKSDSESPLTPTQRAWVWRVKQVARGTVVPPFSRAALPRAIQQLNELLQSPEEARNVPRILAECGIRFVIVESLKSAKIDGVCCWLDDQSPVVGMAMRYDRIDNFWFVLRHELEHVARGDGREIVDTELEGERAGTGQNVSAEERAANAAAAEFCVPGMSLDQFIARKAPIFSERDLLGFARTLRIHPGLVAGQLQRKTQRYEIFRKHLVKVRSIVMPNALVDGWGEVAPVQA